MIDRPGWVPCPKLTLDTELTEPLYVPQSRCITCGGCAEASKAALSQLMVVPKDAEKFRESKRHLHGRCPKTKGWCNASRAYCAYNMVCCDDHARAVNRFCIVEEKMYITKKLNGKLEVAKVKELKNVKFGADTVAVYEVKQRLVLVKTLVPVTHEQEGLPEIKASALKNAKVIIASSDCTPQRCAEPQEFLDAIKAAEDPSSMCGLIVAKTYQPSYELKVVPVAQQASTPKKSPKKKEVTNGTGKEA